MQQQAALLRSQTYIDRDPRFVPIEGSLNFRDFGGYPTEQGKQVKNGMLYRCGSLAFIPAHAHEDFAQLDIGVICDLRRHEEAEQAPSPEAGPFECRVHIPIEPGSANQLQQSFSNANHDHEDRAAHMKEMTRELARDNVPAYQQLFQELLATERGFLLHCTAGKDRTGFGAAMILSCLGVDEEVIFEDYLLTNTANELFEAMLPSFKRHYGDNVDDASLRVVAGVRHDYLAAAIEELHRSFGSIDGYLEEVGVDEAAKQELRHRLTY